MTNRIDILDLSHWNTVTDWNAIRDSGVIGVIMKATEGTDYVDPDFADRREDATHAGLIVSSYHFLRHGSIDQQVQHYFDTVIPAHGERVCIDFEDQACTLDDLRDAVDAILERDPSLQIAIYGGALLKELLGDDCDEQLARHALWIAQYTGADAPSWPQGTWPVWSLWQYSDGSQGGTPRQTDGVNPPIDVNVFNGSRENCAAWLAPAVFDPDEGGGDDVEEPQIVNIAIEASPGITVAVTVNGALIAGGRF